MRRCVAAVVLLVVSAAPVAAGEPTDRLRTFFDRANHVILAPESEGGLEERLSAVRALVNEVFDFEGAAALALGRRWDTLPPPARMAFTRLYADLVERAYLAWVGSKARVGEGGVSIQWLDESVEGDTAQVTSALLMRTGGELPVDYRLVRRAEGWLVRDVVVEGVSLAANYHVQFERVLQTGSYSELFARLLEKAGPAAREQASAASASFVRSMVAAPPPLGVPPAPSATRETATAPAPPAPIARRPVATPAPAGIVVAELRGVPAAVASDARPSAIVPASVVVPVSVVVPPSAVTRPIPTGPVAVALPPVSAAPPAPRAAVAPAVPATPATRTVAAAPHREFWVQVGAFRSADAVARLVARLRRHAVTIATRGDRVAPVMRVLVGPFAERSAAAATVRTLQASGIAAFIPDTSE